MGHNAVIFVEGIHFTDGISPDDMSMMTEGKYFKRDGAYCISYKESEVTGMDGTTTSITVKEGIVTIMRFGTVNSQIIFKEGGRHVSHYDTGFGSFTLGVFANRVESALDDKGGTININYNVEFEDKPLTENLIKIRIKSTNTED